MRHMMHSGHGYIVQNGKIYAPILLDYGSRLFNCTSNGSTNVFYNHVKGTSESTIISKPTRREKRFLIPLVIGASLVTVFWGAISYMGTVHAVHRNIKKQVLIAGFGLIIPSSAALVEIP